MSKTEKRKRFRTPRRRLDRPGATTLSRYRRERRLYRFIFPCQELLFKKIFFFSDASETRGLRQRSGAYNRSISGVKQIF
jgi:hypothetical protein